MAPLSGTVRHDEADESPLPLAEAEASCASGFASLQDCRLCPRQCSVNRSAGERGLCGAPAELRVARAALHFWEEPPISGEDGSGTVFFAHCPLRCVYCQNADIALGEQGRTVSVERLAAIMGQLQDAGALNINCVTPTHYAPQIRQAVLQARAAGMALPVLWNTSGYETVAAIRDNRGFVDGYLTDFKYADDRLAAAYSHASDYPTQALAALEAMVETAGEPRYDDYHGQERLVGGVIVRHLLLPGALENSKAVVKMLHERFGNAIRLSLMNQYTPVIARFAQEGRATAARTLERYPQLAQTVPEAAYEELLDYADDLGIEDYFWQEGGACEESFIPAFDFTGVDEN